MARIVIEVTDFAEDDTVGVMITTPDGDPAFKEWMAATEYLLHVFAKFKSKAGYERACELLVAGSMEFKDP